MTGNLLDAAEFSRFRRDGFIIKRGVLDLSLCAQARDLLWQHSAAVPRLERGDPSSWSGPWQHAEEELDKGATAVGGTRYHYRWHLGCVAADPLLVDLLGRAAHPLAEQLLGVDETTSPRPGHGIICTLPSGKIRRRRHYIAHATDCHVDQLLDSRARLGVIGYIDDVLPGCGALGVWGGSHHRVAALLRTGWDAARQPGRDDLRGVQMPAYGPAMTAALQRILSDTACTDCWGRTGDIVLYHARIVSPSAHFTLIEHCTVYYCIYGAYAHGIKGCCQRSQRCLPPQAHTPMHNHGHAIRQAVITSFGKTEEALPEAELLEHLAEGQIWREWSARVRRPSMAARM